MDCSECKGILYPEDPEVGYSDWRTRKYFPPLCQGCSNVYQKEEADLKDRVSNLEAISAQPGRIPRAYYDQFKQIRGELTYLRSRLIEAPAEERQPIKSGYKGLAVDGH